FTIFAPEFSALLQHLHDGLALHGHKFSLAQFLKAIFEVQGAQAQLREAGSEIYNNYVDGVKSNIGHLVEVKKARDGDSAVLALADWLKLARAGWKIRLSEQYFADPARSPRCNIGDLTQASSRIDGELWLYFLQALRAGTLSSTTIHHLLTYGTANKRFRLFAIIQLLGQLSDLSAQSGSQHQAELYQKVEAALQNPRTEKKYVVKVKAAWRNLVGRTGITAKVPVKNKVALAYPVASDVKTDGVSMPDLLYVRIKKLLPAESSGKTTESQEVQKYYETIAATNSVERNQRTLAVNDLLQVYRGLQTFANMSQIGGLSWYGLQGEVDRQVDLFKDVVEAQVWVRKAVDVIESHLTQHGLFSLSHRDVYTPRPRSQRLW
ncbi:serine/threonine-protein kinase CBK1, partial [Pseudohyphozyma bogoriensis]